MVWTMEAGRTVHEAEIHDQWFEEAAVHLEGLLHSVTLTPFLLT